MTGNRVLFRVFGLLLGFAISMRESASLHEGAAVEFAIDSASARNDCAGPQLKFRKGDRFVVDAVRGECFSTTKYPILWAPQGVVLVKTTHQKKRPTGQGTFQGNLSVIAQDSSGRKDNLYEAGPRIAYVLAGASYSLSSRGLSNMKLNVIDSFGGRTVDGQVLVGHM